MMVNLVTIATKTGLAMVERELKLLNISYLLIFYFKEANGPKSVPTMKAKRRAELVSGERGS